MRELQLQLWYSAVPVAQMLSSWMKCSNSLIDTDWTWPPELVLRFTPLPIPCWDAWYWFRTLAVLKRLLILFGSHWQPDYSKRLRYVFLLTSAYTMSELKTLKTQNIPCIHHVCTMLQTSRKLRYTPCRLPHNDMTLSGTFKLLLRHRPQTEFLPMLYIKAESFKIHRTPWKYCTCIW